MTIVGPFRCALSGPVTPTLRLNALRKRPCIIEARVRLTGRATCGIIKDENNRDRTFVHSPQYLASAFERDGYHTSSAEVLIQGLQ